MEESNMVIRQKNLGDKGLITLITLLSAFIPLSTDLYLPALPAMTTYFHVDRSVVNITLILFFVFYGIGTLFWGPLSDKYGRKPILMLGLTIYIMASILCASAFNIYFLIIFRAMQAVGGSACSTVAIAIVKDAYSGRKRLNVLAFVQSMAMISPVVAPVLGAFLLKFTSWRGMFVTLLIIGVASLIGSFVLTETLSEPNTGSIFKVLGRLGIVIKNPGLLFLLFLFSLKAIPILAYVSLSSYIYQDFFKLSSQVFSYYFALNAIALIGGPLIYVLLSKRFKYEKIITADFAAMAIGGLLICLLGRFSPWIFTLEMILCSVAQSCMTPPSTNLMLEQQKGDTGSVSSLMNTSSTIMACTGMIITSFNWGSLLFSVGFLFMITGLLSGSFWIFIRNNPIIKPFNAPEM